MNGDTIDWCRTAYFVRLDVYSITKECSKVILQKVPIFGTFEKNGHMHTILQTHAHLDSCYQESLMTIKKHNIQKLIIVLLQHIYINKKQVLEFYIAKSTDNCLF